MNRQMEWEQRRVQDVMDVIEGQIARLEAETGRLRDEVVDIRRNFWDDVTVNKDNPDDALETFISMRQQAQVLSQRERSHRLAYTRLMALKRLRESPYFGRIDFREEGMDAADRVYIGVASLTDDSGEQFFVYDWRAPISSVYYEYPPGPASYDTPGGVVRGELEEKWQYTIRGGVIQSMFDTSVTIGDELLQQVLGRGADNRMRSIVATIQQEQNRIIRHDRGRLLIVQGAAGSGKTSAALQRIAYLLYTYRDRLRADQIILFSPNAMFNSYVSTVLPELGEENMQQATFQEYLEHRLGRSFRVEDPFQQLEYLLTAGTDDDAYLTRVEGIRFKSSVHFFRVLNAYRKRLETTGLVFRGLQFRGKRIVSRQELTQRFYEVNASMKFHNRIDALTEWLNDKLDEFEKAERDADWVQEEIELMSDEDYRRAYEQVRKHRGFSGETFDDADRERQTLARMVVRRKMKALRASIRDLRYINVKATYEQLFREPGLMEELISGLPDGFRLPERWPDIRRQTIEQLEAGVLPYEDATPYLLLTDLIEGFQVNTSIKHVLVDEAQDYSPFQFEFLKRLFPAARMTVLGDFNQAIYAHAREQSTFDFLNELYGPDETDKITLSRSYRSTKEIVEFTRSIIPEGEAIIPFDRNGPKPEVVSVNTREQLHEAIVGKMNKLREEGLGTIAVICKSAAESESAYAALQEHLPGLKLITASSIAFEQGLIVIPAYLAKGIEFDAVILYDASAEAYGDESVRRLFYTACTRAMHELYLFSLGSPSPFISRG